MKKKIIIGLTVLIVAVIAVASLGGAVYADCGGAHTAIINCDDDDGTGKVGVCHLLNFVIETMTIGIGILGVLGITITGVQYLTAGGNEEQVKKAKRRLVEVVIGVAMYVLIGGLIQWFIPGHNFCGDVNSDVGTGSESGEESGAGGESGDESGAGSESGDGSGVEEERGGEIEN